MNEFCYDACDKADITKIQSSAAGVNGSEKIRSHIPVAKLLLGGGSSFPNDSQAMMQNLAPTAPANVTNSSTAAARAVSCILRPRRQAAALLS